MNKITKAFENKKVFIAFITGGDPDIETTEKLIIAMAQSGVDIIEIGIPFSDPVAEGIVIAQADERALENGCTVDKLFDMVKRVRKKTDVPLLFMSYINPIFVYGKERFMDKCRESGIDGVIVPDLPFEERNELSAECVKYGITQISMIAPTSNDRIGNIAKNAEGFIYCVSSLGVTGVRGEIETGIAEIIKQIKEVSSVPCAVGFGISTPEQARDMAAVSDGVIIGSAIVKIIAEHGRECIEPVKNFVTNIRDCLEINFTS
jgi:tryptophan synthase alpha chain